VAYNSSTGAPEEREGEKEGRQVSSLLQRLARFSSCQGEMGEEGRTEDKLEGRDLSGGSHLVQRKREE
jgi:hypothetical protein